MLHIKIENAITIVNFQAVNRFNYIISQNVKDEVNQIMRKRDTKLIFDFTNIDFIDSSAIGSLISILKTSKENNNSFALTNVNKEVQDLLEIMQLNTIFTVYPTMEEALSKI